MHRLPGRHGSGYHHAVRQRGAVLGSGVQSGMDTWKVSSGEHLCVRDLVQFYAKHFSQSGVVGVIHLSGMATVECLATTEESGRHY